MKCYQPYFRQNYTQGFCMDQLRKRKIYLTEYVVPGSRFLPGIFFPQHKIHFFPLDDNFLLAI